MLINVFFHHVSLKQTGMKKQLLSLLVLFSSGLVFGQTANVQIIHNCATPVADTVDIYAGSSKIYTNLGFRYATGYLTVPAGVDIRIGIALEGSTSVNDTIAGLGQTVRFEANTDYVAIAGGTVGGAGNPTPFKIYASGGLSAPNASSPAVAPVKIFHGATDAPRVDIVARGVGTLTTLSFGEFTAAYAPIPTGTYTIDVKPAGSSTIVASYTAPLVSNTPLVVYASGFLNPAANGNGPAFGLFAAPPAEGKAIELPALTTAELQVIHNASDPLADTVDVYVGSSLFIDNFVYRKAEPFRTVPGNTDLRIGIALANSRSVADTVPGLGTTVNLPAGGTYLAIANGVVTPAAFQANPSGNSIRFGLYPYLAAQKRSTPGNVSLVIFHGATDAPAVDAIANGAVALASGLEYGEFSGMSYTTVPAANYTVGIHPAGATAPIAKYRVDLSTLGDSAAVVLASGFLTPAGDPAAGKPFALLGVLANGTVVSFPSVALSTGLFDNNFANDARLVYPNPAVGEVTVNNENATELQLINSKGIVVKSFEGNVPNVLNLQDVDAGLYVVKAMKGNITYTTKLSVQ